MTDSETRVLARTAVVLLLVSAGRFAWEARRGPPLLPEVRDDLPALLAESRRLQEEDELRVRPLGPGERVDPNRAPEAELDRLPGVGRGTARAIVEARELGGGFAFPEDLLRVRGIGPATLERVRPHLDLTRPPPNAARAVVGAPTARAETARPAAVPVVGSRRSTAGAPVDLNGANAAALEELPGIGPVLAQRILEVRAARGGFRNAEELLDVPGIGPATLARLQPLVRIEGR